MDPKALDAVAVELLMGLTTDGAHHKQHALESALRKLTGDEWTDQAREEFHWTPGIPS